MTAKKNFSEYYSSYVHTHVGMEQSTFFRDFSVGPIVKVVPNRMTPGMLLRGV